MKYCKNCGEILEEKVKFCGKCGTYVNNEQMNIEMTEVKKKTPNKRKLSFGIIVLCVLLGVGTFWISKGMFLGKAELELGNTKVKSNIEDDEQDEQKKNEGQEEVASMYKLNSSKRYSRTGSLMTYEEYDDDGNVILREEYEGDGKLYSREKYTYDERGKVTHYMYDAIEFIKEDSYKYSYVEKGDTLSEMCYKNGYLYTCTEYEYDDDGNLLAMKLYDEKGMLKQSEKYSYNENGDVLETWWYHGDGELWFSSKGEYDSEGRGTRWNYFIDGEQTSEECFYDAKGKLISLLKYGADGSLEQSTIYEYDENGNKICEKNYDSSGELGSWYEYTYVLSEDDVKEK